MVRILAVENPTDDLAAAENVMEVIQALRGMPRGVEVQVTFLRAREATRAGFARAVAGEQFDVVHFAGHGFFDPKRPSDVGLRLNDGVVTPGDVLGLRWAAPPFIVFNSSCESSRAAPGRRIVAGRRANGLAAAFLARGVSAYLGHFFLVRDASAARLAGEFYEGLFELRNVGRAVQNARRTLMLDYETDHDLTAFGLTFFGDAGTAERADLAVAA